MKSTRGAKRFVLLFTVLFFLAPSSAWSDLTAVQAIELSEGWNSIFLEATPQDPDPDAVFAGLPVDRAAAYYQAVSLAQYIEDPDTAASKNGEWGIWTPPDSEDAFLKGIFSLAGGRAYLVHCTAPCTLELTGTSILVKPRWTPDAFNLTGFPVVQGSSITFARFFDGSEAHKELIIYALEGGKWARIPFPAQTGPAPGRAYWVFCRGASDWTGPLDIDLPGESEELGFPVVNDRRTVVLKNPSSIPLLVQVSEAAGAGGGAVTPLALEGKDSD